MGQNNRGRHRSNSEEPTINSSDIINFANYIYGQIKTQQEVRDRWFGHYMTIVGGGVAFATFTLKFFQDIISIEKIQFILGLLFGLTCILGFIFYLLFLRQRLNYRMHYSVLAELQDALTKDYLSKTYEEYYPKVSPFKQFKQGADFYASLIQMIITAVCAFVSIFFLLSYFGFNLKEHILYSSIFFGLCIAIMIRIYYKFEKTL